VPSGASGTGCGQRASPGRPVARLAGPAGLDGRERFGSAVRRKACLSRRAAAARVAARRAGTGRNPAHMPISHFEADAPPRDAGGKAAHPSLARRAQMIRRAAYLLAAVVSGLLLWLCYFPASAGWLAWGALVPWLLLVRADMSNWLRYLLAS